VVAAAADEEEEEEEEEEEGGGAGRFRANMTHQFQVFFWFFAAILCTSDLSNVN
jgi:hypothetical protein